MSDNPHTCPSQFGAHRDGYWWAGWILLYPVRVFRVVVTTVLLAAGAVIMCVWPSWHDTLCDMLNLEK